MSQDYQPLPFHRLGSGAGYFRPRQSLPDQVTTDDPALTVMTAIALPWVIFDLTMIL